MIKYTAIALAILLLLALTSCTRVTALDKIRTYETSSEFKSLDIQVNAADFTIEQGEKFLVESNLKNLSVYEKDGVLSIYDKTRHTVNYTGAVLKLYVPYGTEFEEVYIATGAGRLTADTLSADSVKLKLGAGKVQFGCIQAYSKINIEGGAGEINIADGCLSNLSLKLGVGKLDMTAALPGKSDLKFGVGESCLTLIGSRDDYALNIEKGIGKITVDGAVNSGFGSSVKDKHNVDIKGGVGEVKIAFAAE